MSHSLCCCSPCRPAFKRHVDGIFPANPDEGLVKNKMETLVYYAIKSPEKLDRIGEYLEGRISHHIYRNRKGFAKIGMEAMDGLIKSCHVNTINLFVESFLKTVQKLLESPDPELQITASQSFSQFSQIKEDTPNYHRSYDFFIERFSQMCHSDYPDAELRKSIRLSGLHGLNGVIRKTVNEELAENIWDQKHMDKIVPSLLYNIDAAHFADHRERETPDLVMSTVEEQTSPSRVADQILRELVNCASFSSIKAILRPVLQFMKDFSLWDEPGLAHAIHTFEAIMYSIQVDLSYIVIDKLMSHLSVSKGNIMQKASVAIVLSKIIGIGVGDSTVGPAVLEIINELLKHLKKSVEKEKTYDQSSSAPLQQLQHALLEALGEYASKMPDFQKIEIMTFILSKVPSTDAADHASQTDHELQLILMKALYCVAEKHSTSLLTTTLSHQLLNTLLRLLQAPDQDVRLLVLQTFQILVDRHNNRYKLSSLILEPATLDLEGYPNKFNRSDQMFAQKSLFHIFSHFKRVLEEQSNSVEFIEAVYTTCALLHVETSATDESAVYLLDLVDSVQSIAVSNLNLSTENRFALHAVSVCFLTLLAATVSSSELDSYVDGIVNARESRAPHMLPPLHHQYHPGLNPNTPEEDILVDQAAVKEALKNAGKDVQRIDSLPRRKSPSRSSWPGPGGESALPLSSPSSRRHSNVSSTSSNAPDGGGGGHVGGFSSTASSPGLVRRPPLSEETSVLAFKRVLEGPTQQEREAEQRRRKEWQELFARASIQELAEKTAAQRARPDLKDLLEDIFSRVSFSQVSGAGGAAGDGDGQQQEQQQDQEDGLDKGMSGILGEGNGSIMACPQPYEKLFPELFTY